MRCPRCEKFHTEHPFNGERHEGTHLISPVRCAFDTPDGTFTPANWNCETINKLRTADYSEREVWNEDQNMMIGVGAPLDFYILSYYKHHGATEGAWVCDGGRTMRTMTLVDAEVIIGILNGKAETCH